MYPKALNHHTGGLYEYKNDLSFISMHIALSLVSLGF